MQQDNDKNKACARPLYPSEQQFCALFWFVSLWHLVPSLTVVRCVLCCSTDMARIMAQVGGDYVVSSGVEIGRHQHAEKGSVTNLTVWKMPPVSYKGSHGQPTSTKVPLYEHAMVKAGDERRRQIKAVRLTVLLWLFRRRSLHYSLAASSNVAWDNAPLRSGRIGFFRNRGSHDQPMSTKVPHYEHAMVKAGDERRRQIKAVRLTGLLWLFRRRFLHYSPATTDDEGLLLGLATTLH